MRRATREHAPDATVADQKPRPRAIQKDVLGQPAPRLSVGQEVVIRVERIGSDGLLHEVWEPLEVVEDVDGDFGSAGHAADPRTGDDHLTFTANANDYIRASRMLRQARRLHKMAIEILAREGPDFFSRCIKKGV